MSGAPLVRRRPLNPRLAWFTALSILGGFGALAWATLATPLAPAIALRAADLTTTDTTVSGLLFWIGVGLLGSLRVSSLGGSAVLTLHLPFIVAATLLGGPAAGGWVALVSTIELREIREVPWYGSLANHAVCAFGAVAGGVAALLARDATASVVAPEAAALAAAVAGALVFAAVNIGHAAATIALREELTVPETLLLFGAPWRRSFAGEVVLAWILAFAYVGIGWWAALVCVALAVLVWESHDDRERVSHDEMTGLLNRTGLMVHVAGAVARARRTGTPSLLISLDLDGFKAINDTHGHPAGDEVLQIVSERLRDAIRVTDAAARVGGDEFNLVLPEIADLVTARRVAERIRQRLADPIAIGDREVHVGSSLGLVFVDGRATGSLARLLAAADRAMYAAKQSGGGVRFANRPDRASRPPRASANGGTDPTGGGSGGAGTGARRRADRRSRPADRRPTLADRRPAPADRRPAPAGEDHGPARRTQAPRLPAQSLAI